MRQKFILNADDFGLSIHHNLAVLNGYKTGFLTSASLCTNIEDAFIDAINNIIPECKNLSLGLHLNIMEGKSLTNCPLLTDNKGYFKRSYCYLILNQNNKELLAQIENEFKAQIEKAVKYGIRIDHIDSHVHTHAIPKIFKITCKLAKKYNIDYVRTQEEKPYLVYPKCLSYKYIINLIKIVLLGFYTNKNKKFLKKQDLKTNDYIIGIGYTQMMDCDTIKSGLRKINDKNIIEAIIHPCQYNDNKNNSHVIEFAITQNIILKDEISKLGFTFTNYNILKQTVKFVK